MSIYTENGYKNRRDYLNALAADYGVARATVYMLADTLGQDEDFDALIRCLEDVEQAECYGVSPMW